MGIFSGRKRQANTFAAVSETEMGKSTSEGGRSPFLNEMIRKLEVDEDPTYKEHMALRQLPREQRLIYGESWRAKFPDEDPPPWLI